MTQMHPRMETKLRKMLLSTMLPMAILMVICFVVFWKSSQQYNNLSHNLAVSSEFNLEFKDTVDLETYYVAIGSESKEKLPLDTVDEAFDVVKKLKDTTYNKDSIKNLQHLSSYLTNLRRRMLELTELEGYEVRNDFMDSNIRIITGLIMTEMQNYIYNESMYIVQVESKLTQSINFIIIVMMALFTATIIILLHRSFRFSYNITRPVTNILHNIKDVGRGNFAIQPVEADTMELQELDSGTRWMAERIESLLDNVKKEKEMQHLTELQLLQAQVNPHFLYNTLDTIVWLIEGGQEQDALDMISSLSVFFRTSLSKGNDIIPLSEEVRHTLSYLEIQKSRYRDILEFEIEIPRELENIMVPKLTLQPLAENALYHGIKNKRGIGKIVIEGFDNGEDIILRVSDTGQGMKPERLAEIRQAIRTGERAGFGLAAVAERIQLYYGPGYGMKINSVENEGTVIEITIAKNIKLKS